MNIAFFDFDGTLVKGDSLFVFLKFYFRKRKFVFFLKILQCLPLLISFKMGIITNNTAKEMLYVLFFKGEDKDMFLKKATDFSNTWISKNLKIKALERLKWHQEKGDKVYVVSASIAAYLAPFATKYKLELIATQLDLSGSKISGEFSTPNCYGKEKANRIKAELDLTDFIESYAYGDSKGDRELLVMVKHPFYRCFT